MSNHEVLHHTERYFDPNAFNDDKWPGVRGIWMEKFVWWQGNEEWYTYEEIGPLDDQSIQLPPGNYRTGEPGQPVSISIPAGSRRSAPLEPGYAEQEMTIVLRGAYESEVKGDIIFPVIPEEVSASFSSQHWKPRVIGIGEILLPGTNNLETMTWESFFPLHYDPSYCLRIFDPDNAIATRASNTLNGIVVPGTLPEPSDLARRLIWTLRYGMVCRLIVAGSPNAPSNGFWTEDVVIESFDYKHKGGEPGDLYYSINFIRAKIPKVYVVRAPGGGTTTPAPTSTAQSAVSGSSAVAPTTTEEESSGFEDLETAPARQITDSRTVEGESRTTTNDRGQELRQGVNMPINGIHQEYYYVKPTTGPTIGQTLLEINNEIAVSIDTLKKFNSKYKDYNEYTDPLPVGEALIIKQYMMRGTP